MLDFQCISSSKWAPGSRVCRRKTAACCRDRKATLVADTATVSIFKSTSSVRCLVYSTTPKPAAEWDELSTRTRTDRLHQTQTSDWITIWAVAPYVCIFYFYSGSPHDHRSSSFSLAWVIQRDGFGSWEVMNYVVYWTAAWSRSWSWAPVFNLLLTALVWPLGNNLGLTKEGNPRKRQFLLCRPLAHVCVSVD